MLHFVDRHERTLVRTLVEKLLPTFGLGLLHCTASGLSALGEGSPAQGTTRESGASLQDAASVEFDSSTADETSNEISPLPDAIAQDDADAGAALETSTSSDVTDAADSAADADADAGPAQASSPTLPIWLDASAPSWCDAHPGYSFCADFDRTPLPAGFSTSDGLYLIQTSSGPSSSPNDLLLSVPPQGGSGSWGSKLSRSFQTPASSVVLAFDFKPDALNSGGGGLLFAALDFTANSVLYSVRLAYSQGAPRLEESYLGGKNEPGTDVYHSSFVAPLQTWSRIQMELTFGSPNDGGASTESIYVNGVLQGPAEPLTPPPGFSSAPNLLIGAVYGTSPTDGWMVRYDNVTLDLH